MLLGKQETKTLKSAQLKLLSLIDSLAVKGAVASADGVVKLANGTLDLEAEPYSSLPGFGCLRSLRGKRGKMLLRGLVQHDYLRQRYVESEESYFFSLTLKGREALAQYRSRPHKSADRPIKKQKKTIIAIEKGATKQ